MEQTQPQALGSQPKMTPSEERTWAMVCHLAALAGFVIPFGHLLGPLVIWLVKRNESALVDQNGKEALNFQISMTIYFIVSAVLIVILVGFLLMLLLAVANIAAVIWAAISVNQGKDFKYPLTIRLIK